MLTNEQKEQKWRPGSSGRLKSGRKQLRKEEKLKGREERPGTPKLSRKKRGNRREKQDRSRALKGDLTETE
jgi:hypothetical protein